MYYQHLFNSSNFQLEISHFSVTYSQLRHRITQRRLRDFFVKDQRLRSRSPTKDFCSRLQFRLMVHCFGQVRYRIPITILVLRQSCIHWVYVIIKEDLNIQGSFSPFSVIYTYIVMLKFKYLFTYLIVVSLLADLY